MENKTEVTHDLKCHPEYFEKVWSGEKTFEVRFNDRNFQVGDNVVQHEWNPKTQDYTGRIKICGKITYVLKDYYPTMQEGFVVFGFSPPLTEVKSAETAGGLTAEQIESLSNSITILAVNNNANHNQFEFKDKIKSLLSTTPLPPVEGEKSAEEMLVEVLEKIHSEHKNRYVSVEDMKKEPEYKLILDAMNRFASQSSLKQAKGNKEEELKKPKKERSEEYNKCLDATIEIQNEILRQCENAGLDDYQTDLINENVTSRCEEIFKPFYSVSVPKDNKEGKEEPDGWKCKQGNSY